MLPMISTRPFQVFVLGICVFGTKFAVCHADRTGILFSPAFDYCTDGGLAVFVRVVRCVLYDLSVYDLGFDSSATILPGITVVERPMWSSLSLFRRDTSIWRVEDQTKNKNAILKVRSDWGSPRRFLEAETYARVSSRGHPGVAEFDDSGNALPPKFTGVARYITINMRHGFVQVNYRASTRLQRVMSTPCSRPLWTCE